MAMVSTAFRSASVMPGTLSRGGAPRPAPRWYDPPSVTTAAAALLAFLAAGPAAPGREPPVVAGVRMATDGPPPAPLADPRGSPGPGTVWIDGHWQWNGGRWSWVAGQWAIPPGPGYAWVPAL